jgi:hypothetical protein
MVRHIGGMEGKLDLCSYLSNVWNLVFNFIYYLPLPPGKEIPYMKYHAQSLMDFVLSHDVHYITVTIIICM